MLPPDVERANLKDLAEYQKEFATRLDAFKKRLAKVGTDKKARDNDSELKKLRKEVAKLYNDLNLIVSPYEENAKDRVLMANITGSPDGAGIIANMNKIIDLKRKAGSETRVFNY
jgi:division protein CdvB (Snf7/Vps24/ESCRT-III family)